MKNQVFSFYMYSKSYVKTFFAILEATFILNILMFCYRLDVLLAADNPLVPAIANLYLADRAKHDELAAEWTLRFAT